MIDRLLLRQQPDTVRKMLADRGEEPALVDRFLAAENEWRQALQKYETLRAKQNQAAKGGKPTPAQLTAAKAIKEQLRGQSADVAALEQQCQASLDLIPNFFSPDTPVGRGESANTVISKNGKIKVNQGRSHQELMTDNSIRQAALDLKTAAAFSGSRFRYLLNKAALTHVNLLADSFKLAVKKGFIPVIPPVLTRGETLHKAGFFPQYADDIYKIADEDLYLTGTSEQTMLALVANQTINEADLPLRFVGYSSCFRREAGSYGKDVEGMFRQHQFDKVEMISITTPEQSAQEHEFLISLERQIVERYHLPYQVVAIGSGDLGPTANKKIDLETWFPSQQRYRETHSASNCTDYQARRFQIKIRRADGTEMLAHTLNATLVTERLLLAIIENGQRPDGSFVLPRTLR